MASIGTLLDRERGIGPGFHSLRAILAISIICGHSYQLTYGLSDVRSGTRDWFLSVENVPMFFVLGGFLVTGSALRLNTRDFLFNRSLRLLPALAVDTIIWAVLFGPLLSSLPLQTYLTKLETRSYFLNIVFFPHYVLPGVFTHNPLPVRVNGALWTIPPEVAVSFGIYLLMVTGVLRSKRRVTVTCLVVLVVSIAIPAALSAVGMDHPQTYFCSVCAFSWNFVHPPSMTLYMYFVAGILAHVWRYEIPFSHALGAACLGVFVCMSFLDSGHFDPRYVEIVFVPVATYLVVYLGMLKAPPLPFYKTGDYSYGLYLYGFPIQQAVLSIFGARIGVLAVSAISLALASIMAMMSWHLVERPVLAHRKRSSFPAPDTATSAPPLPVPEHVALAR